MKKILTLVLALALVFCFVSCGESADNASSKEAENKSKEIVSVVENALKAVAELDYENIEKYYSEPVLTKEAIDALPEDFVYSMKLYVGKLSAGEITVVDNEDDTMSAIFDVTVPDFQALVDLMYYHMIEKMGGMNQNELSEQAIAELQKYSYTLLNGVLEGNETPTKIKTIAIGLEEVEGEWMVTAYDALYDELLAQLDVIINYIVEY